MDQKTAGAIVGLLLLILVTNMFARENQREGLKTIYSRLGQIEHALEKKP